MMMIQTTAKALVALTILFRASVAIVISAPGMGKSVYSTFPKARQAQQQPISLRIRTTKECDLDSIAQILAQALVDPYHRRESEVFNFKTKLEILKAKAGYNTMLHSRLQAIEMGMDLAEECTMIEEELSEADNMRWIWSNEKLRNKIEKAARLSNEPHIWSEHNFACAPGCAKWLQHKMFTAEDAYTGDIVGFCEVAMLSDPTENNSPEATMGARPTVANLVISPDHRRRGIASRLIRSASRYVRQEWGYDKLTLYVEKENNPAVSMYSNLGFQVQDEVDWRESPQFYMELQLTKQPVLSYVI